MKKADQYLRIYKQLKDLIRDINSLTARRATLNSLLFYKMKQFSWVGYYIYEDDKLIVNCYQGPLACIELKKNTGVCWKCFNEQKTIIVPDVKQFEGHIACDANTRSEIAIPVFNKESHCIGVLDIDCKIPDAFSHEDAKGLEALAKLAEK